MSAEDLGDYSFVPFTPQHSPSFESQHLSEFKQKVGEAEKEKKEANMTEDSASKVVEPIVESEEENSASFKADFNIFNVSVGAPVSDVHGDYILSTPPYLALNRGREPCN